VTQILCTTAATARDRRKKIIAQIMLVIHKKSKIMNTSEIFFSFFSTLNQFFPHIPYEASKKHPKKIVQGR
jgi:hypothetical protein